jgi:(p)ppGpp synthase/HD superfamily hydrolase
MPDDTLSHLTEPHIIAAIDSLKLRHNAWLFAARKHQGQTYPGSNLPYLTHIGQVVITLGPALLEDPGLDPDLAICCAILHDTLEDTETDIEELKSEFGVDIAAGTAALTKNKYLKGVEAMTDSLRRIRTCPREVWAVKLSDRISNLGPIVPFHHWSVHKCLSYAVEGEMILDSLGEASAILSAILRERIEIWKRAAADQPG